VVRIRKDIENYNLITEVAKIAISELHSFTSQGAKRAKSVVIFCIRKDFF